MSDQNELFLRTEEAARFLWARFGIRRASNTLSRLRVQGGGPVFIKYPDRSVAYRASDLSTWAEAITRASLHVRSTAEVPGRS